MKARRKQWCPCCGWREVQPKDHTGYCRRCGIDKGLVQGSRRQSALPTGLTRQPILIPADHLQPREPIPVVYQGQAFEIVWNGS